MASIRVLGERGLASVHTRHASVSRLLSDVLAVLPKARSLPAPRHTRDRVAATAHRNQTRSQGSTRSIRLTHRLATADGQATGVRSKDGGVEVKTALNQTSRSESTVPRGPAAAGATSRPFRRRVGERSRSNLTSRWFGRFQQPET